MLMLWMCLYLQLNKIETRFCLCQGHPHFVVNSKNLSLFFGIISVRAENPYSQSCKDTNSNNILMAFFASLDEAVCR